MGWFVKSTNLFKNLVYAQGTADNERTVAACAVALAFVQSPATVYSASPFQRTTGLGRPLILAMIVFSSKRSLTASTSTAERDTVC